MLPYLHIMKILISGTANNLATEYKRHACIWFKACILACKAFCLGMLGLLHGFGIGN
jgi:hypothetical protein